MHEAQSLGHVNGNVSMPAGSVATLAAPYRSACEGAVDEIDIAALLEFGRLSADTSS